MNMRDAQILNARKKSFYCNLTTQVHYNCQHSNSLLSSEVKQLNKAPKRYRPRFASKEEQTARYIDCGPSAWDDRD